MAKGNSKSYSAGGGKKWLIAIALVVLVAIVVVVVLICIPPNTYNAIQTLNRTTQTSFLVNSSKDREIYDDLQKRINESSKFSGYAQELEDLKKVSYSIHEVLDFYNSSLIFASNNKNLKKNFKPIKNNLNQAKDIQARLTKSLNKMKDINKESDSIRNAFVDFRADYISWLKANQGAIHALNSAYTGSMGNILENNLASKNILRAVDDMISVMISSLEKTKEGDKKGSSLASGYYKSHEVTSLFVDFVANNLSKNKPLTPIKNYYFNETIQENYSKFDKFFKFYNQKDLTEIISSVRKNDDKYVFNKIFNDVEDTENLYDTVKAILGGAL